MNRFALILAAVALFAPVAVHAASADPVIRRIDAITQAYTSCGNRITAEHHRCEAATKDADADSQMCLTVANQADNICKAMADMLSALAQ